MASLCVAYLSFIVTNFVTYVCVLINYSPFFVNNALHSSHRALFGNLGKCRVVFFNRLDSLDLSLVWNDCPYFERWKICVMSENCERKGNVKNAFIPSHLVKNNFIIFYFCRLLISWFSLLRHRDIFMIPIYFHFLNFLLLLLPPFHCHWEIKIEE